MPRLLADFQGRDARLGGAGGEASPQTVARLPYGVETRARNALPHNHRYGVPAEAAGSDMPMLIDRTEDRVGPDAGNLE
jgi:hypothetical protein